MSFQNETVVETKVCPQCQASFDITDKDGEFYNKVSPVFRGKKYPIPTPTLCPDCRQQRRIAFRNFWNLYTRKCDSSGKSIVSMYSPEVKFPVYDNDIWWGDSWDPMSYGIDYNEEGNFFSQYEKLTTTVPRCATTSVNCEQSKYSNFAMNSRDCYLVFGCVKNDSCMYGHIVWNSEKCVNCTYCYRCHFLSYCVDCQDCHNIHYSRECNNCSDSWFLLHCDGCRDCFGSIGLKNKQYCIFNKEYTKKEYLEKLPSLQSMSQKDIEKNMYGAVNEIIVPNTSGFQMENCDGNHIYESKNCHMCFDTKSGEDSKYLFTTGGVKSSYDISFSGSSTEMSYNCLTLGRVLNGLFSHCNFDCSYILYSEFCYDSSYLFGCFGLRNKQYCILNKQYTKEEYEELVPKIIEKMIADGEWGEFFPASMSPFGYNETVANEYFPMNREEVLNPVIARDPGLDSSVVPPSEGRSTSGLQHGPTFNWSDYEAPFPKVEKVIPASKLPEDIKKIPDDILNWAIECEVTKKPFRIIAQELEFYRKHNLPIPKRHPDQRHSDRMDLRNPRKLFDRKCDKCSIVMKTTYSPDRPEKVYCEECYTKEAY